MINEIQSNSRCYLVHAFGMIAARIVAPSVEQGAHHPLQLNPRPNQMACNQRLGLNEDGVVHSECSVVTS